MHNSIARVRAVINGQPADRPPLFDLLRNSAVIGYFTGEELTTDNGAELVYRAYAPAIDATRPLVKYPAREQALILPDGRQQQIHRWTIWNEPRHFPDSSAYESAMRRRLDDFDPAWSPADETALRHSLAAIADDRRRLGEVFYFPSVPGPGLMSLYGDVGLEDFSYYLADCPGLIVELLELSTVCTERWFAHLPADHAIEACFMGDDIAFKSGPLLNPAWMRQHYFPRLSRCLAVAHARGIKVLFHSDGNLNPILDDLAAAGIDGLNPLEVLAGMDVADIHRRYPHWFLAGGIDVSLLLPFGSPQAVRAAVRRAIDAAEGRILIGSSTELSEAVPLANFLALRDEVLAAASRG